MWEFVDDTVTCSRSSFAPAVEALCDATLTDSSQKRNVGKTERLLVVPNAPRDPVGSTVSCQVDCRDSPGNEVIQEMA